MAPIYALKTRLFVAIVGVLGEDARAAGGVVFDDFVAALIALQFDVVPSGNDVEIAFRSRACACLRRKSLRVPLPADDGAWWPYEYSAVADALREIFNLQASDFIELPDDGTIEGPGFVVPALN
ncbi:hypothetical protein C8Q73DRAFT_785147 [Cubamyces lactineus]|nr:hypothetical protein C8Q73DRAFT_785147 [Cubamyces lactineus]